MEVTIKIHFLIGLDTQGCAWAKRMVTMTYPRALITGGTGFIGSHLARLLNHPVILTRRTIKKTDQYGGRYVRWDPNGDLDPAIVEDIDIVFHLAGESIYRGRWNKAKKARVLESRQRGTRTLVDAMVAAKARPEVLVSSSAIGFYGDRGEETLTETAPSGTGFLSDVCRVWEQEAMRANQYGIRVVIIRTGVVLGNDGGALPEMLPVFKMGLGGRLGTGRQYMSWIHVKDLVRLMVFAALEPGASGPFNGTSPEPVTNREFTSILAACLKRPAIFPVPIFLLRLVLGEFANALVASTRAIPRKALELGFSFNFPSLKQALEDLLGCGR